MTCWKVTPCLGVSIASTAVVLGIATRGRPGAAAVGVCATDAAGSIAMRKRIMNFIGSPLDSVCVSFPGKSTVVLLPDQKNYSSAKLFMKKSLASLNIWSRLWEDKVIRAEVSTPGMLGNHT